MIRPGTVQKGTARLESLGGNGLRGRPAQASAPGDGRPTMVLGSMVFSVTLLVTPGARKEGRELAPLLTSHL